MDQQPYQPYLLSSSPLFLNSSVKEHRLLLSLIENDDWHGLNRNFPYMIENGTGFEEFTKIFNKFDAIGAQSNDCQKSEFMNLCILFGAERILNKLLFSGYEPNERTLSCICRSKGLNKLETISKILQVCKLEKLPIDRFTFSEVLSSFNIEFVTYLLKNYEREEIYGNDPFWNPFTRNSIECELGNVTITQALKDFYPETFENELIADKNTATLRFETINGCFNFVCKFDNEKRKLDSVRPLLKIFVSHCEKIHSGRARSLGAAVFMELKDIAYKCKNKLGKGNVVKYLKEAYEGYEQVVANYFANNDIEIFQEDNGFNAFF